MLMIRWGTIPPEYGAISPMKGGTSSSAAVASEGQGQLSQDQHRAMLAQCDPWITTGVISMVPCGILVQGNENRLQLQQGHCR